MNQWWQMWCDFFTPEECSEIIRSGLLLPKQEATTGHGTGQSGVNKDIRRSNVRWFDRIFYENDWLFSRMEHAFQFANLNAFNFDISYFKEIQFTEYDASYEGKYDWHEDCTFARNHPSRRKISMVVQLTDPSEYEGGNLELDTGQMGGEDQQPKVDDLRRVGTTIIFPSFLRHRVTPVTKGKRYSLVSWYEGPPFR
jgi:PKHD-type hydroxylase